MDGEKNATGVIGPPSNIGIELSRTLFLQPLPELPTGEFMVGMGEERGTPA